MKKRWIIIIVLVLLLASFTIYQFVNSNSAPVIDMMQAQMATNSSIDRGPIEHALGVDTPFYTQVFRKVSVPAPQSYPATYNPTGSSNSSNINTIPVTPQAMQLQSSSTARATDDCPHR